MKRFKLITRAWYDWNTPDSDPITQQNHRGNFGYAYGLLFHYGKTDGLEREFRALNYPVSYLYTVWTLLDF